MKLSEAIRLGAMVHPQAFGDDGRDGACALRAAGQAIGLAGSEEHLRYSALTREWPFLYGSYAGCPACGERQLPGYLMANIWHLNDQHKWTREQIADWVATVEPAETTSAESSNVDVRGTESLSQPVLATREA